MHFFREKNWHNAGAVAAAGQYWLTAFIKITRELIGSERKRFSGNLLNCK